MTERITFMSGDLEIEGLFDEGDGDRGVVITHPHPLYGGNMHNNVVESLARAYGKKGYATLRFNFRGTGGSQGAYEEGVGERRDVLSAISFLFGKGVEAVDLAGYSFGAWVNARTDCGKAGLRRMIMVSPPAGFMDFQPVSPIPCLELVVTGSRDDIAPPALVSELVPAWNPHARLEIIDGADHFYSGRMDALESLLDSHL